MRVAQTATVLLIATLIGVPALHVFRPAELGNPPPNFEAGLWWGPQVSGMTPTGVTVEFSTLASRPAALVVAEEDGAPRTIEGPTGTVHRFVLTGLRPGTTYTYQVRCSSVPTPRTYRFRTPPADPAHPVRFAALGDTGSGTARQMALVERIDLLDPEFVVVAGDLAYPDGTPAQVRARFTIPWSRIHHRMPIFVTLGNHDVNSDGGLPILDAIALPTNDVDHSEAFYATIIRSVRLISINSEDKENDLSPGTAQRAWLERTLAEGTARWTLVFGHRAIYPGSRSGGDANLRNHLVPLLEQHGVDIYLSGHDHVYMRTFPMRAHTPIAKDDEPNYRAPGGPIHVVSGGGGKSLYTIIPQPHLAKAFAKDHLVLFEATPEQLTGRVLNAQGDELDRFSIR